MDRQERHRMGPSAHRGTALQRAGGENDRANQETDVEEL